MSHNPRVVVNVTNPAAGHNWTYSLTFSARVKAITFQYSADSTTGTRELITNGWPSGPGRWLDVGSTTASGAVFGYGVPDLGKLPNPVLQGAPSSTALFGFPDEGVMPVGSSFTFTVTGYQGPNDQWSDIHITLEPA